MELLIMGNKQKDFKNSQYIHTVKHEKMYLGENPKDVVKLPYKKGINLPFKQMS